MEDPERWRRITEKFPHVNFRCMPIDTIHRIPIEKITVQDILGKSFFCQCEDPWEGWKLRLKDSPFAGFPGRAYFVPYCQTCDRPIYELGIGRADR